MAKFIWMKLIFQRPTVARHGSNIQPLPQQPQGPTSSGSQIHTAEVQPVHDLGVVAPKFSYNRTTFKQRHLSGKRFSLAMGILLAFAVLCCNLVWLFWAQQQYDLTDRYGIIYRGDCSRSKSLDSGLHALINILSTALLTASGGFVQAFSSPTRAEVDAAHAKKQWLHIGSISFRNLRHISYRKSAVVVLLLATSVPFHLLYNAMIFKSSPAQEYNWAVVTPAFVQGAAWDLASSNYTQEMTPATIRVFDTMQRQAAAYERLDPGSCFENYTAEVLSKRGNLLMISKDTSDRNNSIISAGFSSGILPPIPLDPAFDSVVSRERVDHCLNQQVKPVCIVRFNYDIMIIVLGFNVAKILAMIYVWWRFDAEQLLSIPGDALQSFIQQEDETTRDMCLADQRSASRLWKCLPHASAAYVSHPDNWYAAISIWRWRMISIAVLLAVLLDVAFIVWGNLSLKSRGTKDSGAFGMLGMSPSRLLFRTRKADPALISILANLPHLLMAPLYLMINSWVTAQAFAWDFCELGRTPDSIPGAPWHVHRTPAYPKFLMVSKPRGDQRGPWLAGMPLIGASMAFGCGALLHWLISQAIFPVQIDVYSPSGTLDVHAQIINCGFSIGAMVAFLVGILFTTYLVFNLAKEDDLWNDRVVALPPVVSTNSAALSAACHVLPDQYDESVPYEEIRWGAVREMDGDSAGHCAIVSQRMWNARKARHPSPGDRYGNCFIE